MIESLAHLLTSKTMSTWVTDVAPVWAVAEIFHYVGMLLLNVLWPVSPQP